jgi:hypothetical protein
MLGTNISFCAKFAPLGNQKKLISTHAKDFKGKTFTKFLQLGSRREPKKKSKIFLNFLLSYLVCRQIWLNPRVDNCQCGYIIKLGEKTMLLGLVLFTNIVLFSQDVQYW